MLAQSSKLVTHSQAFSRAVSSQFRRAPDLPLPCTPVRVHLLYNPSSGRGRAQRIADRFRRALIVAGHEPILRRADALAGGPGAPVAASPDALALIGGDGTVKHALAEAIDRQTPVYHVPLGNENLFAREFGMTRDPARLVAALRRPRITLMDVARVEGHAGPRASETAVSSLAGARVVDRFAIMLSLGPDASVIHRMHQAGRDLKGHLAYLAPIAEELAEPHIAPISAVVDGRPLVERTPGLVVVANLRRYGFGVNPARHADPADGLLDVVFIPATAPTTLILAGITGILGRLDRFPGVRSARGREVTLDAPGAMAQVDGEALAMSTPMRLTVEPQALRVLMPP